MKICRNLGKLEMISLRLFICETHSIGQYDFQHLKIPRKPAWSRSMTPEEVDKREREAFLQWRREIAV